MITFITLLFINNLHGTYKKWLLILIAIFIGLILVYMFLNIKKSYNFFSNFKKKKTHDDSLFYPFFKINLFFNILNTILLISLFAGLILIIVKYKKIRISNKKYSSSYDNDSDNDSDSDEEEDFQVDCNCNICKEYYAKPYNTY